MKISIPTNIEVLENDVDVEFAVALDNDGCVAYIDLIEYCEDCEEYHIRQRFAPIEFDENDEDDDDEDDIPNLDLTGSLFD